MKIIRLGDFGPNSINLLRHECPSKRNHNPLNANKRILPRRFAAATVEAKLEKYHLYILRVFMHFKGDSTLCL